MGNTPNDLRKGRFLIVLGRKRTEIYPEQSDGESPERGRNKGALGRKDSGIRAGNPGIDRAARPGSKTAKMLQRPGGATFNALMRATEWLAHSVRGFLSGTISKNMGLTVMSLKGNDGDRTYSVKA